MEQRQERNENKLAQMVCIVNRINSQLNKNSASKKPDILDITSDIGMALERMLGTIESYNSQYAINTTNFVYDK